MKVTMVSHLGLPFFPALFHKRELEKARKDKPTIGVRIRC